MSGTDLFTSVRGPGLIGTLLALIVVGGFSLLAVLVFDESLQGGGQEIESVIEADAKHIEELEGRVAVMREEVERTTKFREIEASIASEGIRRDLLVRRREQLEEEVAAARGRLCDLEDSFSDYRQSYRESARASMVGRKMDQLTTSDGKTYTHVEITKVDPVRMQIRHEDGITGVPLELLSDDFRDYLQLDGAEKEERLAREADARAARSQRADQRDALKRIKDLKDGLAQLKRDRDEARRVAARAEDAIPQLQLAIREKKQELAAEEAKKKTGGISNAPQVRSQLQQLEEKLRLAGLRGPEYHQKIAELEKQIGALELQLQSEEDAAREKEFEG
ncbi:hypothetical protein [Haloferula sp. A504]|uniref:hypothetical protein n=1 Tax=Haloferula sp. A504 TaxID=3373601 RepID=UPI0031CC154A|nr:hypothetical protein [Verrucomicrobiaceae bacterium E54]